MKVAIVHDYIKEYGGAEKVLEALHDLFPKAPIFTLIYAPKFLGPHQERFKTWNIKPSFLNRIPFNYKLISIFRIIAPLVFKTFNFTSYDVIIVSATGAYAPNMINKQKAKQICYCHTPPRYLYGYATARKWKKNLFLRTIGEIMNHILRMVDFRSSQKVDLFIANSQNIANRIQKFYHRESIVIYPPAITKVEESRLEMQKENYFLTGGRLARPKHFDLIIKAANKLNISLKIFGKGFAGYGDELSSIAKKNIEFLGEISDEEKFARMKHAKAFIMAAEDEDFGIVPVEAMSQGTPIIAYRSGGLLETIIENKTGIFFDNLTTESLVRAIKKFQKYKLNPQDCKIQAEKFSREKFQASILKTISQIFS